MKHKQRLDFLYRGLSELGLNLSIGQQNLLDAYVFLIDTWSRRQNLMAKNDLIFLAERHLFPCFFIANNIKVLRQTRCVDVGSGAGLPGIIIQILWPELDMTLIDSSRKKYLFLKEVCEQLGLKTKIIRERVENYSTEHQYSFDYVVTRAVAHLEKLWRWSYPLLKVNGALFALKGGNLQSEITALKDQNIVVEQIKPGSKWIEITQHLEHKILLKLEKKND